MTAGPDTQPGSVRDRLIDAAEACLQAKGIRATTVSEVAEVAGVSRGWLYRHFPDKAALLGAALVRLNNAYWGEAHAMLAEVDGLAEQIAAGVALGRSAYDSPGALLMRLRQDEPEEFAACAGAGVQGLVPDLSTFWLPYLAAAQERGEITVEDLTEAAEWVARALLSVTTVPGNTLDPDDRDAVIRYLKRYLMPALKRRD
ncbi:MAG TPA: helix-turn-helix domain-containing protein [Mycobacterium sp.]|nr:helix-turn-helix domain-containing protein [Mycobacterium sp.]